MVDVKPAAGPAPGAIAPAPTSKAFTPPAPTKLSQPSAVDAVGGSPSTIPTRLRSTPPVQPPVVSAPTEKSFAKAYEEHKTAWRKAWEIFGKVATLPFVVVLGYVGHYLVSGAIWAATQIGRGFIEKPVWLFGKIFGIDTKQTCESIRKSITSTFAAIGGVADGVLRIPQSILGTGVIFARDFLSLSWLTSGQKALTLFLEPIFSIGAALAAPAFYAVQGIDSTLHPPRALTPEEGAMLERYYTPLFIDSLVIHPDDSFMRIFSTHGGFTVENHIYVESYDPKNPRTNWLPHEATHTMQYRDTPGGAAPFLGRYFAEVVAGYVTDPARFAGDENDEEGEAPEPPYHYAPGESPQWYATHDTPGDNLAWACGAVMSAGEDLLADAPKNAPQTKGLESALYPIYETIEATFGKTGATDQRAGADKIHQAMQNLANALTRLESVDGVNDKTKLIRDKLSELSKVLAAFEASLR